MEYLGGKKFYELRWVAKQFAEQQLHNNFEQVKTAQIDSVLYMANWICRMLAYSTMWAGHWDKIICWDCGWTWLHALLNCAEFFHFVLTLESTQHLKDFSFLQYHKILSLESVFNYLTFDRNNKTKPNSVSIIKFSHLENSPYHRPALSSVLFLGEKNM